MRYGFVALAVNEFSGLQVRFVCAVHVDALACGNALEGAGAIMAADTHHNTELVGRPHSTTCTADALLAGQP